jgi:beta-glucanase (GH16 family)
MKPSIVHYIRSILPLGILLLLLAGCETTSPSGGPPEANKKTIRIPAFDSESAPKAPTLEEGGFAAEPAFEDTFDPDWERTQTDWQVATWVQNGTQMSPARCRTNGQGHLVQTVLPGEPYRGGSLQSKREFGYGRWLARVRPPKVAGTVNSIFTKDWDDLTTEVPHDGRKAEVDIEFLTYTFGNGRGQVHLAIHLLNKSPLWHADVDLDFDPSDNFNVWGFDILPDRVVWHVNGKVIHTWMYTEEDYVDPGYEMFFNSWTRDVWVLGPPEQAADYHIDWVRFHPLEN